MSARTEDSTSSVWQTSARQSRPRRVRFVLATAVVGIPLSVVLLMLALRNVDMDALTASIAGAEPGTLGLAVSAIGAVYLIQAVRWRLVSAARVPVSTLLVWVLGSIALNNVVPGRPGDLLRAEWLARGARLSRARALASVFVDRGLDLMVLVAALVLTYPAAHHASWLTRLWIGAAAVGIAVGVVFVAASMYARRARMLRRGRLRALFSDLTRAIGTGICGSHALLIALLSVLAWGTWALSAWLVASSLGIGLTPWEVLFVTAVINLGVAIPSSPGFIGTYQWLAVSALGLLGVSNGEAFAFSIVMHAAWFVPTTLAGAFIALRRAPVAAMTVLPRPSSERHAA
jgi:uncharacterized protein (TIRG00374 family)